MPRYLYHARDNKGELATGVVAAATVDAAGQLLRGEGKYVVRLKEVHEEESDPQVQSVADHSRHVKRQDVIFFAHQMAIMIETGVPISEALDCVTDQAGNPHFKAVMTAVADHVRAGGELSVALRKHPRAFPPIMTSLIRASEISGTMATMLERISQYLDKEERTRRQVKAALTYPLIMMSVAVSVTVFLLTFVLPRFTAIYASRGAALPTPTRILMAVSSALVDHWQLWLIGLGITLVAGWLSLRTATVQRLADWLKLHVPVLRTLYQQLYLSRSCRALGTMLTAGVSVLDAIDITRQVTPNVYFQDLWDKVDDALKQGLQLSDPMGENKLVPRSVVQMIRSGEKSGRLADVLQKLAVHTEEEFDHAVKSATQFIEPMMVIFMGALVGFVAISLLLPIFNVSRVVSGG